ncbi:MAG: [acyl-carrier-protein] S-malonyltransferase [Methylococcaceae bacterium]|nr:MAG: [acyl-carrier-protein] S-malonyltransferase [Methylococcaceae bacterium]
MEQQNYLALVFPGQGSQSVGMLSKLAADYPEVKETFAQASQALGFDLWQLVDNGPEDQLNLTLNTQPAMLAAGVATYRVWRKQGGVLPGWMAGHSLGEYTALVCAEALTFEDAIKLVRERARLMQDAVPAGQGAMAAILGLTDAQVVAVCNQVSTEDSGVSPANFNAPGQVVIAGHSAAVNQAIDAAKQAGAKRAIALSVSVPSHCPLMESAAEKLLELLEQTPLQMPSIPVLHNVDVETHAAPEVIRNVLAQQLSKPVRWAASVKFMHEQGVSLFLECGPGKVLTGLNKRIASDARSHCFFDADSLAQALEMVK